MSVILLWSDSDELAAELSAKAGQLGTAKRLELPRETDSFSVAKALADAATKEGADLVLVGATKRGKDVGPRVAGLLDWSFSGETLAISGGTTWTVERMVLSGNSKATYTLGAKAVCTVMAKTFEKGAMAGGLQGASPPSPVQVVAKKEKAHTALDLGSAPIVVGVGRGFKKQEDIALAEALAKCFPGGAVGCSRPIAADLKWLGEEHWIGLSGHAIKPKAYIACGISGQIQHVAGIRGAKLIIAVNTNKDAPIMQVADYAVVGDLYKVLPDLTAALKA